MDSEPVHKPDTLLMTENSDMKKTVIFSYCQICMIAEWK